MKMYITWNGCILIVVNQNDAIVVWKNWSWIWIEYEIFSVGHWFKLTERQYVDLSDFGITEEMQKPAAHWDISFFYY